METYRALGHQVLAVASVNEEVGDWAAYIGAVEGMRHSEEWQEVASSGDKQSREIAEAIFPEYKDFAYRN